MADDGVVQSLFHQALLQLLSFLFSGDFPLDALAFLPLVIRRRVFLLLPIMVLHRLELTHPAVTEGIDMEEVWKEVFAERLCPKVKWLTKKHKVRVVVTNRQCRYEVQTQSYSSRSPFADPLEWDVWRVVFAVPFGAELASQRLPKGLRSVNTAIYDVPCNCEKCRDLTFVCAYRHITLFNYRISYDANLEETYLATSAVLTGVFAVVIDSTLVIDTLAGLMVPPFDVNDPEFHRLFGHVHTLQFNVNVPENSDDMFLDFAREFIEALLTSVLSHADSDIQNLHLCTGFRVSNTAKYRSLILRVISSFFTVSRSSSSKVVPFLGLKGLKIEIKPVKQEIKRLVSLVRQQEELERLELLRHMDRSNPAPYYELLEAARDCFYKPTFQCLTLKDFRLTTSVILDIEYDFLVSTACEKQQLVLEDLRIDSSSTRRSISFPTESAACTKSLSVIECSVSDMGIFSAADLAAGVLSHPGTKSLRLSRSLEPVDPYKLAIALEQSSGTLRCLDLSECDLSFVMMRAGPLFSTIFNLPRLSELKLVLEDCHLQKEDFEDLYREWEKGSPASSKARRKRARQSLRKLCIGGDNCSPINVSSNLKVMAHSVLV